MAASSLIFALILAGAPESDAQTFAEAQTLAADGQWKQAARLLTPLVDPDTAAADPLVLLTRAVLEAGDVRRARLLSERGLLRYPDDVRFRRLDLAVLVARRQWSEAAAAAKSVIADDPTDPIAWRQWAAAALEGSGDAERRAVLEAAHLAVPDDRLLFEKHVRAQFLAEHFETAVDLIRDALTHPELSKDPKFIRLAVRVAEAAGDPTLARRWLDNVPPAERDRSLSLLEARIALAEDDPRAAERAFERLISRGEASPAVLLRAGQLAEDRGAWARAEALYAQAAEGRDESARIARLYWARFLVKIGQRPRAERVLRAYLAEHPADEYARQLFRVVREP